MYNVTVSWVSDGYPVNMDFGPFEGTHVEAVDSITAHFNENYGKGYLDKFEVEWDFKDIELKEYYYLISDNGDGSSSVRWFKDKDKAQFLVDSDIYSEEFGSNEGSINVVKAQNLEVRFWSDDNYEYEGD